MKTAIAAAAPAAIIDRAGAWFAARYPLLSSILFDFKRPVVLSVAAGAITIYAVVYLGIILTAENLITIHDLVIGGDFIVFWSAAQSLLSDNPLAIYDRETIGLLLAEHFPRDEPYRLYWQYPPTMLVIIAPFAALPYVPALWVWNLGGVAVFSAAMLSVWRNYSALFIGITAAVAFQALITGQTGFLTAALLTVAAAFADRRPIIAGIAAGLLTVKPQLGLLIPIAFAAAGCWRAFGAAAVTAIALAAVSTAIFGAEAWLAFYGAATTHGGLMSSDVFPYHKLITPLGFFTLLGAPSNLAMALQITAAMGLAGFVFYVWRTVSDWDLRAMALLAAAPLASPYAFYYEMTIFIPALLLLARRGLAAGWLPGERAALSLLWIAPLYLPGDKNSVLGFLIALSVVLLCARRILDAQKPSPQAA